MKLAFCLLLAITPLAVHAQIGMRGPAKAVASSSSAGSPAGNVEVTYVGTAADTTVFVTTDSAAELLKTTHAQVIFMDSVRSSRKALAKLDPHLITGLHFEEGQGVVNQYGAAAKDGVLTIKTRPQPAAQSGKGAKKKP